MGDYDDMGAWGPRYAAAVAAAARAALREALDARNFEVDVEAGQGDTSLEIRVRRLYDGAESSAGYHLDQRIYHFDPDGRDPGRHATWIACAFEEDKTAFLSAHMPRESAPMIIRYPDGRVEHLTAEESSRRGMAGN